MGKRAREVVAEHSEPTFIPRLADLTGTIELDVNETGVWRLRVDQGNFDMIEGSGDADVVVACDEANFVELIEGRQNLLTAVIEHRVQISGHEALAFSVHVFLPRRN